MVGGTVQMHRDSCCGTPMNRCNHRIACINPKMNGGGPLLNCKGSCPHTLCCRCC
jgi:hypothetical protein